MYSYRTAHCDSTQDTTRAAQALAVIHRARVARSVAGAVLALVAVGALGWSLESEERGPARLLLLAWPVAIVAYVSTRVMLRVTGRGMTVDLVTAEHRLYELEILSVALPLTGVAFASPLTLHSLIAGIDGDLVGFSRWMRMSVILVGHAHLALAIYAWLFADSLHHTRRGEPLERSWLGALGTAVFVSAVPGIVVFAIPPVLALLTGLFFIPPCYLFVQESLMAERARVRGVLRLDTGRAFARRAS
jgi:hypothetical protein